MIQKEYGNTPWIRAASCYMRTLIFVQEQKISPTKEFDSFDTDTTNYLVAYYNQNPIATARFYHKDHLLFPGCLCVHKNWRYKGLGSKLLMELEIRGKLANCHTSIISCQKQTIPFFEKLDYQVFGHPYIDSGHIWFTLKKELTNYQLEKIYQLEHI
ncbi:GNAT family N-acetyltransferase [Vagococcus jeotgali]|uniref:GNAT family N-acetyltransferase n=1 Tax=Vagococcus jeotgali TaxID=3109030 RepID=UPI002DDB983D|nr:GNAT family N-acetyltransferase [Vagococcus sp. B2T-5]